MSESVRVEVESERGRYPVIIGAGTSTKLDEPLGSLASGQRLVVSSRPIWNRHGRRMKAITGRRNPPLIIPDGERAKQLRTVTRIYEECARRRLDRSAALIAFGGGVVGDVAGFAAATYLRGIRLIQIPTTLLAQVDSSIGGKVGVNLPAGKNLVGSFHSPSLVICDPDLLRTLPDREFRAGLYEVVKYGIIASRPLFDQVSSRLRDIFAQDRSLVTTIVSQCCGIKAAVVMRDEREGGPRRVLNFGHTVGHALEALTEYRRFRHGEAIGWGMLAAARLSAMRGLLSAVDEAVIIDLIRRMGPRPRVEDLSSRDALGVIARDKKVIAGTLHFVLARGIGDTEIVSDVTPQELVTAMKSIGMK
jgi:3-dehydroquinate synthase